MVDLKEVGRTAMALKEWQSHYRGMLAKRVFGGTWKTNILGRKRSESDCSDHINRHSNKAEP